MGKNNATHYDGQVRAECPECERTIRLSPSGVFRGPSRVLCGCGERFTADRETGEVI